MNIAGHFGIVLLLTVVTVSKSFATYYQIRPTIAIYKSSQSRPVVSKVGDYDADYSNTRDNIANAMLVVVDDPTFGCPPEYLNDVQDGELSPNNTIPVTTAPPALPSRNSYFVVMVPLLGSDSPCPEYEKARTARKMWGAEGIIFRYDPSDPQQGRLERRPNGRSKLSGITVTTMPLERDFPSSPLDSPTVSITAHYHQFQTTHTFYFIVFAFCILMLLSCLWFVMSYMKRCHHSIQRRRRRVSLFS